MGVDFENREGFFIQNYDQIFQLMGASNRCSLQVNLPLVSITQVLSEK